jgi:hypothetical protein
MASDPDRHRVVPTRGGDSKNGRARCPSQPSPGTCAQRRSPSSSRCPQRRSAAGPRRACCPTSGPWAATDATPTPRSGPCWKPCPSHSRPASRAPRLSNPAPLLSVARWPFGILRVPRSPRTRTRPTSCVRETIRLLENLGERSETIADLRGRLTVAAPGQCQAWSDRPVAAKSSRAGTTTLDIVTERPPTPGFPAG